MIAKDIVVEVAEQAINKFKEPYNDKEGKDYRD
jgi:hypothetical protein